MVGRLAFRLRDPKRRASSWVSVGLLVLVVAAARGQEDYSTFTRTTIPLGGQGLIQDRYGFVWIPSALNVRRYDGHSYRQLHSDSQEHLFTRAWNIHGIAGGRVRYICLSARVGEVVFCDISRFSRQIAFIRDTSGTRELTINQVIEDRSGRFWIGCEEGDLLTITPPDTSLQYVLLGGGTETGAPPIRAIAQDSSGDIWYGTDRGLFRILPEDPGAVRHQRAKEPILPGRSISALTASPGGGLWVHTQDGLTAYIADQGLSFRQVSAETEVHCEVTCMVEDLNGDLWLGHLRGGLRKLNPRNGQWEDYLRFPEPNGLQSPEPVLGAILDRCGFILAVSGTRGLLKHYPPPRAMHRLVPGPASAQGLSGPDVASAILDRDGTLWVGRPTGGIDCLARGASMVRRIVHKPGDPRSLSSNFVVCMLERGNGEIWIGNAPGGLNVKKRGAYGFLRLHHARDGALAPGSDTITAMYEDRRGAVWVGHYRGIDRFDPARRTFTPVLRWPTATLGRLGSVTSTIEDTTGYLWFGTAGRGLLRLTIATGDTLWYHHNPTDARSLPNDFVLAVFQDREGRHWFGTHAGLAELDLATGEFTNHERPLMALTADLESGRIPSPKRADVCGIVQDRRGYLWLSSLAGGIVRFDPATDRVRRYWGKHGIVVRSGRRSAFFVAPDGSIYVGGAGGINWFRPDSLPAADLPPPLAITQLTVHGAPRPLPSGEPLSVSLEHTDNTFSIDFALLHYANWRDHPCAYLLEGVDRNWVSSAGEWRASYASVPPGTYTFRVRGYTDEGLTDENEATLSLTITPPFWRTGWFGGLAAVLIVSLVYGLHRYRVAQLLAVERLRLRIADDLHDDVGSELSGIALESDLIARRLPLASPERDRLTEVSESIRRTADTLRDAVWIVNPELDSLEDLVDRMRSIAARLLAAHRHEFEVSPGKVPVSLDMEFRRHVLLMFKEALNNIVRHARATSVRIRVRVEGNTFTVCVEDNGIGFDVNAPSHGRGLATLRSRAAAIGGRLILERTVPSGTRICLEAQIIRSSD